MHLIQEMQDHPESLVVHAHIVFEVVDQVGPRQIHVGKGELVDSASGDQPLLFDPDRERSPIHFADRLERPLLLLQGLDDKVVPPSQAEQIVEALQRNGVPYLYVPLEGEGHGYRRSESLKRVTELGLSFYGQVFGFEPADDVERAQIENL